jgi:hypothetical protein
MSAMSAVPRLDNTFVFLFVGLKIWGLTIVFFSFGAMLIAVFLAGG